MIGSIKGNKNALVFHKPLLGDEIHMRQIGRSAPGPNHVSDDFIMSRLFGGSRKGMRFASSEGMI